MEWIDNIIVGLIDTYSTNNPYELCDLLEIIIIKIDKDFILLNGHESAYFRNAYDREVIYIRDDLEKSHEEFYLSHELGHAILHTHVDCSNNLVIKGKFEKQANYFAFKLSDICFDERELKNLSVEQIACCLEVPLEPLMQLVNL